MLADLTVRRVDHHDILALRATAFGDGRSRAERTQDLAPSSRHWAALLDGVVVGCATVVDLRGWALRGVVVARALRRRGLGRSLMQSVSKDVAAPMWCHARQEAVPFYEHLGWTMEGPSFDIAGQGAHRRMAWSPQPESEAP